jgi:hypothetical protein
MSSNRVPLAFAALAATTVLPATPAPAAELPSFDCGSPTAAISWSSGFASQPTFFNTLSGASGDVQCEGSDFLQVIPRKAGEGQKDFLKITMEEVFLDEGEPINAELKFDEKIFHKLIGSIDGVAIFDNYFELTQLIFISDSKDVFREAFLGLKITTLGKFDGLPSFKWDSESQSLHAIVTLQAEDATLRLTAAPGSRPPRRSCRNPRPGP